MSIILKSNGCSVTILPEYGGIVNSMIAGPENDKINIIYGYEDESLIHEQIQNDFRGTKLSPFPNRIKDGSYNYDGIDYNLNPNFPNEGHAIHGLLYDKEFSITYQTSNQLELEYDYDGSIVGYPFPYLIKIAYSLVGDELSCTTYIKNKGVRTLPIGDGFHPYLKLDHQINQLNLKLPIVDLIEVDDRMIPNGKRSSFSDFNMISKIAETVLDSCFSIQDTGQIATTVISNDKLRINLWQETGENKYNFIQIYTPPDRSCIAWEPMTCPPDVLNNKIDLIELEPNQEIKLSFGIQVSF